MKVGKTPVLDKDEMRELFKAIEAAGIAEDKKGLLFRSTNRRTGQFTEKPLRSADAWAMVRSKAKEGRGN